MLSIIKDMYSKVLERGRGVFKFLFVIDDFVRIFTMTILIPILFNFLRLGLFVMILGALLGLVIDMHDFMSGRQS